MSSRRAPVALLAVCAMLLVAPLSALAAVRTATPHARSAAAATSLTNIPVTGKAGSKKFTGHYTVDRFVTRNGKTYALGTLTGKLGTRSIHRSNLAIPASVPGLTGGYAHDAAASCAILHLVLGPLNLNLLGLHVHLNKVVLDITAVPGPGNLLGNLLCGIANLLNGGGVLPAGQVTGLLNIVQQLLNNPSLLNL